LEVRSAARSTSTSRHPGHVPHAAAGPSPEWADATAWPELGAIFLRSPDIRVGGDEPLEQVLDHELVHVLLGRAFGDEQPPIWLQEGVAQVLAKQLGPRRVARSRKARRPD
jgi:hypothetical protein